MAVTLNEAKQYLRVDSSDEDVLIENLLRTSKRLVMDVGRLDSEEELEAESAITDTAVKFCLSYLYENRNSADYHNLTMNLRYLLFAQREGAF
ncbi:MAG: head-tail connector protein [Oscillospiraceae bacterium]|nr:head-tail connector protein [Oscillospiraceae bacterium]